jgi:hypothetical protein
MFRPPGMVFAARPKAPIVRTDNTIILERDIEPHAMISLVYGGTMVRAPASSRHCAPNGPKRPATNAAA